MYFNFYEILTIFLHCYPSILHEKSEVKEIIVKYALTKFSIKNTISSSFPIRQFNIKYKKLTL